MPGQDVCDHIDGLWSVLERAPEPGRPYGSLLPLPFPYVVPGGRFARDLYWDSYFTMLGLEQSRRRDLALDMVRNFASLIDRYGHVPNGNRTYYLSRSQPPFFAAMVELVASAAADADAVRAEYLPALSREYAFWMDGADTLAPGSAHRRVVRLSDGTLLNRYWDDRDVPREESYREDVATAAAAGRPAGGGLSRPARRGRERLGLQLALARRTGRRSPPSAPPTSCRSISTASWPSSRRSLADAHAAAGAAEQAQRARGARRAAQGGDAALSLGRGAGRLRRLPLARGQAQRRAHRRDAGTPVLRPCHGAAGEARGRGGPCAPAVAGRSRDHHGRPRASNGTRPMAGRRCSGWRSRACTDYGETGLAETIAARWMTRSSPAIASTGKLVEKYNVADAAVEAGGGEYPTQDGFGWTNGVLRRLLALYPDTVARDARTAWCPAPRRTTMIRPSGSAIVVKLRPPRESTPARDPFRKSRAR